MADGRWSLPDPTEQDEPGQRGSTVRRRRAVLATAVVAAAIVAVLLATGAFSGGSDKAAPKTTAAAKTTPAVAPAQKPAAPLVGTWKGTATQTATTREKYSAEVRLAVTGSTVGEAAGTLSEKARGKSCKGVVKLVSTDAGYVFRYDEKPSQTGCIDRTTVTVKPLTGGEIDFYEIYTADDGNQGTVVGKLGSSGGAP